LTAALLISRVISKNGHQMDVVHRADDGLARFQERKYDLVITDVFMAGKSGIKGIIGMRQARPGIPIIAISAGFSNMSAKAALSTAREVGSRHHLAEASPARRTTPHHDAARGKPAPREMTKVFGWARIFSDFGNSYYTRPARISRLRRRKCP
jgi:CheY-like chemotaxis protein